MRILQLSCAALVLAGVSAACNRPASEAGAERTAEQVRTAAAKAGEQVADSWLTTKIQAQYFADDDIKATHINVSTRDGVVTLTGSVNGQAQRDLAVQIAKTTDGVREVQDQLSIAGESREGRAVATTGPASAPASTPAPAPAPVPAPAPTPAAGARPPVDDAQVTARVQSAFFLDDRIKMRRIDVKAHTGVVTLSGEVASEDERAQALRLARSTEGVQRVEDHLAVVTPSPGAAEGGAGATAPRPRVDDATLTTTIQARYFVDSMVKRSAIEVSAKDGVVQLQGTVPSEAARAQALSIARNVDGVVQVVDRLTVAPAKP